jgi:hypothetical protein
VLLVRGWTDRRKLMGLTVLSVQVEVPVAADPLAAALGQKCVQKWMGSLRPVTRPTYKSILKHWLLWLWKQPGWGGRMPSELSIEMATYARCCWNISQPLMGPIWHGMFYNEYPGRVTDFEFKSGIRGVGKDDFGKSYCNCEHTWGTA